MQNHSMQRFFLSLLAAWLLLAACIPIQARSDQQNAAPISDIFALNQRLGRGVNLGNALEAPGGEGEWGLRLTESDFALIAEAGFNSVRVPINWAAHAKPSAPFRIDEPFFERIDWVIAQSKANGLAVVLDMHGYDAMMRDPSAQTERFLALWRQIAERYQSEPADLLFELLNEPNGALIANVWNQLLVQAIAVVRESNPTRAIVVGPVQWNNVGYLRTLRLPNDRNLIITFHYYEPFQFTHQGAEWVDGANAWLGTPWAGNSAEQSAITTAFDAASHWAAQNHRPLFLGEFGAYGKADLAARARWTAFVAQAAQERNISFAYWEFGAGFGVYDRSNDRWNEELLNALIH